MNFHSGVSERVLSTSFDVDHTMAPVVDAVGGSEVVHLGITCMSRKVYETDTDILVYSHPQCHSLPLSHSFSALGG